MATLATQLAVASLTPPSREHREALNAECLRSILAGLPLPQGIGPRPYTAPSVSTTRKGIERILDGVAGGQFQ
jgi:hypothetical protein